ncbi:MAG TPA: hydrogenase formation protein HypD [Bacteroidales bacterium]|nr:hydrogenase formation protein HypD [Bacteroidales bacterium]
MKHIDEYRDRDLIKRLADQIKRSAVGNYVFMEVCGGHTSAIHRFGIPSLLPGNIRLISGPGCPVCVTGTDFIDQAIAYSQKEDVIIGTFGDLIKVPGSKSSLEKERMKGADIRILLSALEAFEIAINNPDKKVIFLGIGFETTSPGTAVTIKKTKEAGLENLWLLSAHKIMPPAMEVIVKEGTELDGFICPGHVATVTGSIIFEFLPQKYHLGCVIAGFEPADILMSIIMLIRQVNSKTPEVEIQYKRAVNKEGNVLARRNLTEVFEYCDTTWRGFGVIPSSGLKLRKEFANFDALEIMPVPVIHHEDNPACLCGDILRGLKTPSDCSLFRSICSPENPVGACMVSNEGACNSFFKYNFNE